MELCSDRVFYVMTECGQDQRALCCDTTFCVVIKLVKAMSFFVAIEYFYVGTEFGLRQGFLCRDRIFYVATEYGQKRGFVLR